MSHVEKVFGVGSYRARWVQRSSLVELSAYGLLPCLNYSAELEMRPERVLPPMWNMVFYVQDYCLTATKPFFVTKQFALDEIKEGISVVVHDATGEVEVPVEHDDVVTSAEVEDIVPDALNDLCFVYARLPKHTGNYVGCIVAPVTDVVLGIFYRAFGPATRSECDEWVKNNCSSDVKMMGGEIPWPLVVEN